MCRAVSFHGGFRMASSTGMREHGVTGMEPHPTKAGTPQLSSRCGIGEIKHFSFQYPGLQAHSPAKLPAPALTTHGVDGDRPRGRDVAPDPRALGLVLRMEIRAILWSSKI